MTDSFGHYSDADKLTKWSVYNTSNTVGGSAECIIATGAGPRGGQCLKVYSNGSAPATFTGSGSLAKTLTTSGPTCIVGFRYKVTNSFSIQYSGTNPDNYAGNTSCVFRCGSGGTNQWWIQQYFDGTLKVYRGSTLLGTSSIALVQGVWTYVEAKVLLNASTGTVDMRFNNVSVLSLTGQNTANVAGNTWNEARFGPVTQADGFGDTSNGAKFWYIADFVLMDGSGATSNNFLGDVRVDAMEPTTNGTTIGWTPLTGTNVSQINETLLDDDTSYVSATSSTVTDIYKTGTQPVSGATILGVQVNVTAKKVDAGTSTIAPVIADSGGGAHAGVTQTLGVNYQDCFQAYDINPVTGVAWVDADIGPTATQFGMEKVT